MFEDWLVGGFQYLWICQAYLGWLVQMTFAYFWAGLKPPTRWGRSMMVRRGEVLISNMTNLQLNSISKILPVAPNKRQQKPSYKVGFTGGLWLGFWWIKNPFGLVFLCVFTFNQVEHTIPGRVAPAFKILVPQCPRCHEPSRFGESFHLKLAKPSTEGTMPSDFALGLSLKEVHNKSEVAGCLSAFQ